MNESPAAASEMPAPHARTAVSPAARMLEFHRQLAPHTPRVWVAYAILAINVAVFLAQSASGVSVSSPTVADLIKWGGDLGTLTTHGQWWRTLTCIFVHAGIVHLAMNMFVLWSIGPFVERLLGNLGFLVLYLFAGIAGSLASLIHAPSVVSIGASGAIFGLYGGIVGFLLRSKGTLPNEVVKQLWRTAGAFIFYNVLYGMAVAGLDQAAHFGGFIGGALGGLVLGHPLDARGFAGRTLRSLVLAALGIAGFCVAVATIPKATDFQAELKQYSQIEQTTLDRLNQASTQNHAGQLTNAQWSDIVEQEVLPPWRVELTRLRALPRLDARQAQLRDRLADYLNQRIAAEQMLAQSMRTNDAALNAKALELQADADALAKKITQP